MSRNTLTQEDRMAIAFAYCGDWVGYEVERQQDVNDYRVMHQRELAKQGLWSEGHSRGYDSDVMVDGWIALRDMWAMR